MPDPNKYNSKKKFLDVCIPKVLDEGTAKDRKQAAAICNSMWKDKKERSSRFSYKSILNFKENADDIIVKGYIATTHFDGEDIITKATLDEWAKEINEGNPRANKVSVNHNRVPHVAGVGLKGTARVDRFPDGEYGLYVETLVDKTREDFAEIKYRLENDFLDSFSIEYIASENARFDDKSGARILDTDTVLYGWTLASQPMNEHAVIVKELFNKGVDVNMETKEETPEMEKEPLPVKEKDMEEEKKKQEEESKKEKEDVNMENATESKEPVEQVKEFSEEDVKLLQEAKERKLREEKEKQLEEMKSKLFEEFKEEMKNIKVENKTLKNTEEVMESKEVKEFKEALEGKTSIKEAAARLAEARGMFKEAKTSIPANERSIRFGTKRTNKGVEMQYKGLGITTNKPSDTDYLLSAAELNDVFDPVIYNTLNQKTVFWNILEKDDLSSKGNNLVQFTVKDTANSTAGPYTGNAVTTGNVGREKLQTKFKKYQVGVEVDGDMIAAARGGPIGDVFAQEVEDSTVDLLSEINQDLFTEKGAETDAEIIGLPYLSDASGNTTLYNLTRSSYGFMDGNSGATYINASSADISLSLLRQAKRQAVEDAGSEMSDLVFVCDYTQGDKFRGIYDSIQRVAPTSSRFGFEGMLEFDGIPIFEDKDCKSGSWFLVDLRYGYRVGMWVPPTLEMLGKDSDSMKGFIKTYFATYSRNPNSVVEIYGAATS
jgi:hypothetical protein